MNPRDVVVAVRAEMMDCIWVMSYLLIRSIRAAEQEDLITFPSVKDNPDREKCSMKRNAQWMETPLLLPASSAPLLT